MTGDHLFLQENWRRVCYRFVHGMASISADALTIAEQGVDSIGTGIGEESLRSKEGWVLLGKAGRRREKRYLILDKHMLLVKKNQKNTSALKNMTFDLKKEINIEKKFAEVNTFTISIGKQELVSIYAASDEDFNSWLETLLHNKTVLDQVRGQREQKNVKGEVDRFNMLWANEGANDIVGVPQASSESNFMDENSASSGERGKRTTVSGSIHPPEYSGYMTKRGGRMKTWRKRWFVLEAFTLSYFKVKDDKKPKAMVNINGQCKVLPNVENKKVRKKHPNAFCLITNGRTYFFDCDDKKLKSDWLFNIRRTINMAKGTLINYIDSASAQRRPSEADERSGAIPVTDTDQTAVDSGSKTNVSQGAMPPEVTSSAGSESPSVSTANGRTNTLAPESAHESESAQGEDAGTSEETAISGTAEVTPESRISNILSKPYIWNRMNETEIAKNTSQVEFSVIATNLRPPKSNRRKSMTNSEGHGNGPSNLPRPISCSHVRIKQSKPLNGLRFPENTDLKNLKGGYDRIGQHPFRTNSVEKLSVAVYTRACVIDVPKSGDRAIEVSLHVEDSRCRVGPETPWGTIRFTISSLLGSPEGILRIPLEVKGQRNATYQSGTQPMIHIVLSNVPYDKVEPRICELWGMQAQTYAFRTADQELVRAREECHETIASFQVPLLYLKLRAAEWVSNLAAVKERCEKNMKKFIESDERRAREMIEVQQLVDASRKPGNSMPSAEVSQAKKRLASLKKELGRIQSAEERSAWVLEHLRSHNKIVSHYSAAIDLLTPLFQNIPPNAYKNKCISLTFKKSSDKKKSAIRMLPTNLHMCIWRVWKPAELPISTQEVETCNAELASVVTVSSHKAVKRTSMLKRTSLTGSSRDLAAEKEEGEDDEEEDEEDDGLSHDFHMTFTADGAGHTDTIYDTVTFGAPAAHALSFKKGGLRAMIKRRKKLLDGENDLDNDDEEDTLNEVKWFYKDEEGVEQGPWNTEEMRDWYSNRFLNDSLPCRLATDPPDQWISLGDRFKGEAEVFPDGYGEEDLEMARAAAAEADIDSITQAKGRDEMKQEADSMTLSIEQRKDLTVCQALSALVLSFSTRLEIIGSRSAEFLQQLAHVGYLFQVESLVSTHGDEQGMLDDFIVAMDELQGFVFRLSQLGDNEDTVTWQKRARLTHIRERMAAFGEGSESYKKLDEASVLLEEQIREEMEVSEEQWYYCDDQNEVQGPYPASYMRQWYPDYLDDNVRVQRVGEAHDQWGSIGERFAHCGPFPSPTLAAVRVGNGLKQISMERGDDNKCIITLKVPKDVWAKLPEILKKGKLINVHPILVQQGINEFQSYANRTGKLVKLQSVVNKSACEKFNAYMQQVLEKAGEIGLGALDLEVAHNMMKDFEIAVEKESPSRKNVDILQSAQRLTRSLKGGRGICCKSAKDRTSMSLTLEQALLMHHNESAVHIEREEKAISKLEADEKCALYSANLMREYGVRIMNAKKNVGKRKVSISLFLSTFFRRSNIFVVFVFLVLLDSSNTHVALMHAKIPNYQFAFNKFQRSLLPKLYRPPRSCIGDGKVES